MLQEIKKGILSGLGAVMLTRDKVEETTRKLVEQSKLSEEDASKLADELYATGERQWEEMQESIAQAMKKVLKSLDIAGKGDMQALMARLENLEKRVTMLEEIQTRPTES
jgi:polyhydroxyalkanoate synthesis regulator phasin